MSRVEEIQKQIKKLENKTQELQKELELEKQKTEIEYPFEVSEYYYYLNASRDILKNRWNNDYFEHKAYAQGNVFKTAEEAERERDKRALLTRFRQFRDKCNGDWKPDFKNDNSRKHYIAFHHNDNTMTIYYYLTLEEFNLFGYFKNASDAERAIYLFGDEIKRLWVECE